MTTPTTSQLHPNHMEQLTSSAIAKTIIAARGYCSIAPGAIKMVKELTADCSASFGDQLLRTVLHQGALIFPIYRLGASAPYAWVLRPELPRSREDGKPIKYEWPSRTPNVFDVLPRYADALGNPDIPIWITEGAKKADALASVYDDRVVPINLNGVYGWRGKNAYGVATASADMELIAWEGRQVVIAPDGDVKSNQGVRQAVERLTKLLIGRYRVAEILILYLPMERSGPKIGVDDYLAAGNTTNDLEAHLVNLASVTATASVQIGIHPETNAKLFLPPRYEVQHQSIVKIDPNGNVKPIYSGGILVKEIGVDLHTREQHATVMWNGRGDAHGELMIPRAAMSDAKTFGSLLGAVGAAIHPENRGPVATFLVEFIQHNIDVIPHRAYVNRLGQIGEGFMLPAGAIGLAEEVRYTGNPKIAVGKDTDAYPTALRQALTWPDAWAFWLVFGLSLASPAVARLRPRRNPVLYLSGGSGSGKTTISQFVTGTWGDPMRAPLKMEAIRTTPAGIFQTLEQLNGLPLFIDEAHMISNPQNVEAACYSFANGQRYTAGGADQKARGGSELSGALFLAGEAIPEFKHAGSRLRVLWVNTEFWPPMGTGAEAQSSIGQARAEILEKAWNSGAGLFGKAVTEIIWRDWTTFVANVHALEADVALSSLHAWRAPLAIAAAALNIALGIINAQSTFAGFDGILDRWAEMLTSGHDETDAATSAWEALLTMLAQGERRDDAHHGSGGQITTPAQWDWIEADRGGGMIAAHKNGDQYLRVISNTPQLTERVGPSAIQLHGPTWLKRGWILPAKDGKSTELKKLRSSATMRVLKIPLDKLDGWSA